MKRLYLKSLIILVLILGEVGSLTAQRSNGLAVEGKVTVEEGSVDGAIIQMYEDGRQLDNYGIGSDGNYKVELNYGHKFELIFSLAKNFSQKIVVDTNLPKGVAQTNPSYPPFPVNINLFTEIEGIDKSFSENTVLKIYYSAQVGNFISDLYYNDAQIKKLIDQAILQSQMIDKEADYLSRLTRAELAELRKEYDQLLKEADAEYGNEKFLDALDGYKAANQVFPNEQYPKDRIAEINDLLGMMMVEEEMNKALTDRFNTLIANADQFFNTRKYFESRNSYNRALSIRPTDSHANQRVKEINDILKGQQTEQQYQDLIVRGNNAFNEVLYDEALKIFTEASELKPNEAYPKTKIKEINERQAELAKNTENQKNYDQAIFQAELNYEKQFYDKSLASYENALKYKPGDEKATNRIQEIKDLMNNLANRTLYDKLITSADKFYKKEQLQEALADYQKALELFPNEKHPSERVSLIQQTINAEADFLAAVKNADDAFDAKQYQNSKNLYSQALELKSGDKHSQDRMNEIDGILASMKVDDQYNAIIAEADQLFAEKNLEEAKNKYTEALAIKSKEQYPRDKITEIDNLLKDIAAVEQQYTQAVKRADDLFAKENYKEAKTAYAEAGTIKPAETYPPEMIVKIDDILAEQARLLAEEQAAEKARQEALANEKDQKYQQIIDEADSLVKQNELVAAVSKFRAALDVKPQEQYPIVRIEEIRGMISRQQETQKLYDDAIAKADKDFDREAFDDAKTAYNDAKSAKPAETYPDEMLAKIDSIVTTRARLAAEAAAAEQSRLAAAQAEKDSLYNAAIANADNSFNSEDYENARTSYRSALDIKPEETYPQQKIDEIGTILARLSEAQKAYEDAVARGDRDFRREAFDEAKTAFNDAKTAKPSETYPDEMLAKIDSIVTTRARLAAEAAAAEQSRLAAAQAEKDSLYNAAVASADNSFNSEDYENARTSYRSALDIKPEETYPQQKIDEIGTILARLSEAQKAYEDAVARGDRDFGREAFDEAKTAFNDAKTAKPAEAYPDEMLAKIDSIVTTRARLTAEAEAAEQARLAAAQAEKDSLYNAAIASADNSFNSEEYENARTSYRSALDIKPEETYPQQKINEIGTILAQLSEAQKAYEDAVARGDRDFRREAFDEAKTAFNDAKTAKPSETYPDEMLAKIDSIVTTRARLAAEAEAAEQARLAAAQAEKDSLYNAAIASADNSFNSEDYENARTSYRSALDIKPEETYPQQKIDEIGTILARLSEAQKAYEDAVARGDRDLGREAFDEAKTAFNEAKTAKPSETYPDEMLAKIDSIVTIRARLAAEAEAAEQSRLAAAQAEKDSLYNAAVASADNSFNSEDYENARTSYRSALDIKPEETYPQQKIDKIGTILARLSEAQKAYEDAVARGDLDFRREVFDEAKTAFNDAKTAKPSEIYPDEMLAKIDSIVTTRARLAAEAEAAEQARLAAAQAEKDSLYNAAIASADNSFNSEDYENARTSYRSALDIKPEETYPQQKIDEIGTILARLSEAQKAYEDAVARGDRDFRREAFDEAKTAFNDAKTAKPSETYPDEMLAKIDSIVTTRARLAAEAEAAEQARLAAAQAEKDSLYNAAVAQADGFYNNENYASAKTGYNSALSIKPGESYPQQQIDVINKLLEERATAQREQEKLNRDYENAIQLADNFFKAKSYIDAQTNYLKASTLKPEGKYPTQRITEIDEILRQQKADEDYRNIIVAADGFFKAESYNEAKTEYEKALNVKPDEQYPRSQIGKIDDIFRQQQERILAEQQAAADLERRRNEIQQKNEEARDEEITSQAGLDALYNEYIQNADRFFDNKDYNTSRGWYYKAWDVKPEETYPPERIAEINRLVGNLLATQRDRDYQGFIDLADSTFRNNQLAVSRGWYNRALSVKPNEEYPRSQLSEIQRLVNERLANQSGELFNSHMQKASEAFEGKNYSVARFWYKKALELRPDAQEVKTKLSEIEEAIR